MAYTHTWKITQMDRFIDTKIVYNVHFAIETLDSEHPDYLMTQNFAVGIFRNSLDPVIDYDQLSESQVIEWVKKELKIYQLNNDGSFVLDSNENRIEIGDQIPDILSSGERQLNELINPIVETATLPWNE